MLAALRLLPAPAATTPPVAGYLAWWDGSDAASITSSGGLVSQWNDKSGNGYHLSASGADRPSTTTLNGLGALSFGGSNFMGNASIDTGSIAWRTQFAVIKLTGSTGTRTITDAGGSNNGSLQWRIEATTNYQRFVKANVADIGSGTVGISASAAAQITSQFGNTTSYAFWIDGAAAGNASHAVTCTNAGTYRVGANNTSEYLVATLAELLIYDSQIGTTDRQAIEAYLKTKWSTP